MLVLMFVLLVWVFRVCQFPGCIATSTNSKDTTAFSAHADQKSFNLTDTRLAIVIFSCLTPVGGHINLVFPSANSEQVSCLVWKIAFMFTPYLDGLKLNPFETFMMVIVGSLIIVIVTLQSQILRKYQKAILTWRRRILTQDSTIKQQQLMIDNHLSVMKEQAHVMANQHDTIELQAKIILEETNFAETQNRYVELIESNNAILDQTIKHQKDTIGYQNESMNTQERCLTELLRFIQPQIELDSFRELWNELIRIMEDSSPSSNSGLDTDTENE